MLTQWLIDRAKRTPYFHLTGYMNRWWLVPYNEVIWRTALNHTIKDEIVWPEGGTLKRKSLTDSSLAGMKVELRSTDGTGPVNWKRRPIARLLQKLGIAVRVHEILRSDAGDDPHDHPWPYLTVILRGGYTETCFDDEGFITRRKWHGRGSVMFRRAKSWHQIDVPPGTTATTLFITGPKAQRWGFNVDGVKVPYDQYKERA